LPAGSFKAVKKGIKRRLKMLRQAFARTFRSFTPDDLLQRLRQMGIVPGDVVLVHSSYDAFDGFSGKPTDVIAILQRAVGVEGALLMPTMAFTGTAVEYVSRTPVFDVARTPSRMGLLSELFRRSPGVVRSIHPTHPVAIWGRDAEGLAADHHRAGTPCGAGTPFARLLERQGKILLLGADIDSLTFYHTIEEMLETRLPASPFTHQVYQLTSKLPDGTSVGTQTRLFEPSVSRRRNLGKLMPELRRLGGWHESRVGRLKLILLGTGDVLAAVAAMADRGAYCYD
jgi:aminoglycoside 3-N-acetyltransferase